MLRLAPDVVVEGHRLMRRLGIGAGGEVWLALTPAGDEVAMKIAPRHAVGGPGGEAAFRREFEQLRPLRIPNVVRVHDVGSTEGFVYFTMEVARGLPFDQHVRAGLGLAAQVDRLCRAGAGVARALAAIHRLGLAHRDLKPANVLVGDDGDPVVLDFGTARFATAMDDGADQVGTTAYMAPEWRVGLPNDKRVDLYALGATLHEALSGTPATAWRPGRPRTPLLLLGAAVPRPLSWLVDRMLSLDPAARPAASEAEAVLSALAEGAPLAPAPWPAPPAYVGDTARLLSGNTVVVGTPGSGRRRMVQEARWQWYRKGYRSVAGRSGPERPFGPLRDVLTELYATAPPQARRDLPDEDSAVLRALWPELGAPGGPRAAWPPDPAATAAALGRVLGRFAPLAVVLWEIDELDVGTAAVLPHLLRSLPEGVLLWGTARKPVSGARAVRPPPWSASAEREVLPGILPEGLWPDGPAGGTPLESCARAWGVLARYRKEPPIHIPLKRSGIDEDLLHLAILEEPFPVVVAKELAQDLDAVLSAGHLAWTAPGAGAWQAARPGGEAGDEPTETTDLFARHQRTREHDDRTVPRAPLERVAPGGQAWLRFADPATRRIARAAGRHRPELQRRAARAWEKAPPGPEKDLRFALHTVRAGDPRPAALRAAVAVALERGEPAEVERWMQLQELHCGPDGSWESAFAELYARAALRPDEVGRAEILALGRSATNEAERGRAGWLLLRDQLRGGEATRVAAQGQKWSEGLAAAHPEIASALRREAAEAWRALGRPDLAVQDGRAALELARAARPDGESDESPPLSAAEVHAGVTLAGAQVEAGSLEDAIALCRRLVPAAAAGGLERGEGGLLATLARAQLLQGDRQAATETAARCRAGQPRHRDPRIHAAISMLRARLSVELGDVGSGVVLLDEATTAARAQHDRGLEVACAAVALEAAVHAADAREARRALSVLQDRAPADAAVDLWPASAARWRWLIGDLDGALALVGAVAGLPGHAAAAAAAERARLLLIAGRYEEARHAAESLVDRATAAGFRELAAFGRLVAGAAGAWPEERYHPLLYATRRSRWIHLYLGGLHLDAIRRQLRREPVSAVLRDLRARSADVGHRLYQALARDEGW